MRKLLIASHGRMAQGVRDTLSFFAELDQNVQTLCAFLGDRPVEDEVREYFAGVAPEDEVIIFTDLMGGSVNRAFLPYLSRPHTHLVAGMNLGLILETVMAEEGYLSTEEMAEKVELGKKGLVYLNEYHVTFDEDDDI